MHIYNICTYVYVSFSDKILIASCSPRRRHTNIIMNEKLITPTNFIGQKFDR